MVSRAGIEPATRRLQGGTIGTSLAKPLGGGGVQHTPRAAIVSTQLVPYLPEKVGALVGFSGGLIIAYLLVRRGLVAALVARFVSAVKVFVPTTLDLSSWYADTSAVAFASVAAVPGYGAWIAVGRQEIWRASALPHRL
jgi:hypothetical protein